MNILGVDVSVFDILWILLALLFVVPFFQTLLQRRFLMRDRASLIKKIEVLRKSRVITLIHRQEGMSLLGFPMGSYIDIDDSEAILRAIRFTPKDIPIDVIIHTPGGLVLAATQIAMALKNRAGEVRVIVPHYAMSGGTLIALAADKILMDENAVLGPIDPQISTFFKSYPAASLIAVSKLKDPNKMDDETLVYIDVSRKALDQTRKFVCSLLKEKIPQDKLSGVCEKLTAGIWTHDHPLTASDLKEMGIKADIGIPKEVYDLMDLYPQPRRLTPSVEYIPVPYKKGGNGTV